MEHIARKQKPVLLATGASDLEDVKRAMDVILKYNSQVILMQCNTNYTASDENYAHINLNVLRTYHELYPDCILGLSDHTFGDATVLGLLRWEPEFLRNILRTITAVKGPTINFR